MINIRNLISAREAAERLGVKLDTLYAYVSRGRLRSVPATGTRERRYPAEDVEALLRAGEVSRRSLGSRVLAPDFDSSLTEIREGRLYYRGRDAVKLADSATLEEVARLLWGSDAALAAGVLETPLPADECKSGLPLIERCQTCLASLSAADPETLEIAGARVLRIGSSILQALSACVAGRGGAAVPAHRSLAARWGLDDAGADIVRRCLVLSADHDLDTAALVARCVASTGATLYQVVAAGLAPLAGPRHGSGPARAEALFRDLMHSGTPMVAAMAGRLVRGEDLPGFGHDLYPAGDPRAAAILTALATSQPAASAPVQAAVDAGIRLTGRPPNLDFALAAAATGLQLPIGGALALFVVGRAAGWIAHAIEQYQSGLTIRPRTRYTGAHPAAARSGGGQD